MVTPAVKLYLRQHATGERALVKSLRDYFAAQTKRILLSLADYKEITTAAVKDVFSPKDETGGLIKVVEPHLVRLAATGASTQLAIVRKKTPPKADKAAKSLFDDLDGFELPKSVREAIAAELEELESQDYWADIQGTTEKRLIDTIRHGMDEGLNGYDMRKRIEEALGGDSTARAKNIARTETTGAFNAGHDAVYKPLAEEGLIVGKTWIAILDKDVRETHADLHDTTVGPDEEFDVGGESAPYPGYYGLSAEERCNYRCTTIAAFPETTKRGRSRSKSGWTPTERKPMSFVAGMAHAINERQL